MKRSIAFIIIILIVSSLFSFPVVAVPPTLSPTIALSATNSNNVCTVTVKLKGITTPLMAAQVVLNYDKSVMSYSKHTTSIPSSANINEVFTNTPEELKFAWIIDSSTQINSDINNVNRIKPNSAGEVTLCTISFAAIKNATPNVSVISRSFVTVATIEKFYDENKDTYHQISPYEFDIPAIQIPIAVVYTAPQTEKPDSGGPTGGPSGGTPVVPVVTPTPTPANTFIDLGGYDWASSSIYKLSKLGIIKGTSENTFSPANNITRADFAVLLSRTFNLKGEVTGNFDDVPAGEYFYQPIGILKSLDIAKGSEGKYNPYASITRQDIIVLTHRALTLLGNIKDSPDYDILNKFEDKGSISNYATESVCIMISRGIIKGNDGQLAPLNNATRAEAAVIFDRIYNILPK